VLIDDRVPSQPGDDRPAIEPNWRAVGWVAAAVLLAFAAGNATGFPAYLILCATVYAVCRAATTLLDYGDGLREWRQ
jgi:hypothetical protein